MMRRAGKTESRPRGSKRYNRTPLTTYYRSDTTPSQSPFNNRTPKKNVRKYVLGIADVALILFLLGLLVYSLILSDKPQVEATNNSFHSNQDYERLISADFAGMGNHNKITFNDSSVVSRIESRFPEIDTASIELPFFSEHAKVRLVISPPAFRLNSQGRQFVIDLKGVAVAQYSKQPQFAKLPIVTDQSDFQTEIGRQIISSQAAVFIDTVIRQAQHAKVPLGQLSLPAVPLEFDLRAKDQPYLVKFYLNGDPSLEAGQYLAARQKFAHDHITPTQYLDVRVAGKIFYK